LAIAVFYQEGHSIDYTPSTAKVPGEVVSVGTAIQGVVPLDLEANRAGSLRLDGVFLIEKKTAGDDFARGDYCTIDGSNKAEIDNVNGRHVCVEAATIGVTHVKLKLNVR
jgi:predicted RecA/RadA family phage recombinase